MLKWQQMTAYKWAVIFAPAPIEPARLAVRDPCQVAAQNIGSERYSHQERTHPEAPVAVHPAPVGAWVRLAVVAAMSFVEVPVSCHIASGCIVAFRNAVVCAPSLCSGAML
jgi:hypothetical protein